MTVMHEFISKLKDVQPTTFRWIHNLEETEYGFCYDWGNARRQSPVIVVVQDGCILDLYNFDSVDLDNLPEVDNINVNTYSDVDAYVASIAIYE